jgi:hypothetical protein
MDERPRLFRIAIQAKLSEFARGAMSRAYFAAEDLARAELETRGELILEGYKSRHGNWKLSWILI